MAGGKFPPSIHITYQLVNNTKYIVHIIRYYYQP